MPNWGLIVLACGEERETFFTKFPPKGRLKINSCNNVIDPFKALDDDAPLLRPDKEGQKDNQAWHWEVGDKEETERVFNEADVVVKEQMHIPRILDASDGIVNL